MTTIMSRKSKEAPLSEDDPLSDRSAWPELANKFEL